MSNLRKNKLKGKRIGVYFGTFAGLTLSGHAEVINEAKRENDGVVVIVSGRKGDRGDNYNLPLNRRFRYIREEYANTDMVYVEELNEEGIPEMPYGWDEWLKLLLDKVSRSIEKDIHKVGLTFYMGEKEYGEELHKRLADYLSYENYTVKVLDRKKEDISATKVREQPIKYFQELAKPFRRVLSYNILVVGTASGGKTELVKDLARRLNAPYCLEYARYYQEKYNIRDEEYRVGDWDELITGTFKQSDNLINSSSNMGITIHDTDNMVNLMYLLEDYNNSNISKEDYDYLKKLAEFRINKAKWDLILVIPPTDNYVDDGFRNMNQLDSDLRDEMNKKLLDIISKYKEDVPLYVLDSKGTSDDPFGFYGRYKTALEIIVEDIKKNQKYNILTREDI